MDPVTRFLAPALNSIPGFAGSMAETNRANMAVIIGANGGQMPWWGPGAIADFEATGWW